MDEHKAITDTTGALSATLMAAAFASEQETWPAFLAYVERQTGHDFGGTRAGMELAITLVDSLRSELEKSIGQDPGPSYLPRLS